MVVTPDSVLRDILLAISAATTGDWDQATLHLYQNDFVPARDSVPADFTEADFDGYAAGAAISWNAPITNIQGDAEVTGPMNSFVATGDTTPNEIFGYYVLDAAGTGLLWAERFDNSVSIVETGQGIAVVPRFVASH